MTKEAREIREVPGPSVCLHLRFMNSARTFKQPPLQDFSMKAAVEITILCFVLPAHQLIINDLSKAHVHNAGLSNGNLLPCKWDTNCRAQVLLN